LFCFERFNYVLLSEYTPLHLSSKEGHLDVGQFLLEKGADVNAKAGTLYDTAPHKRIRTCDRDFCFVCDVLILVLAVESPRCIGLLQKAIWAFASFS
jgi:ankyrin repeat protein